MCDDSFDDIAADAICREMNFTRATSWISNELSFSFQDNYDIKMDDVVCTSVEWEDCSFNSVSNCGHYEDVFLNCSSKISYLFSFYNLH